MKNKELLDRLDKCLCIYLDVDVPGMPFLEGSFFLLDSVSLRIKLADYEDESWFELRRIDDRELAHLEVAKAPSPDAELTEREEQIADLKDKWEMSP